jgi:hypothetical protein
VGTGDGRNIVTITYNLYQLRKIVKITPEVQKIIDHLLENVHDMRLENMTSKGRGLPK